MRAAILSRQGNELPAPITTGGTTWGVWREGDAAGLCAWGRFTIDDADRIVDALFPDVANEAPAALQHLDVSALGPLDLGMEVFAHVYARLAQAYPKRNSGLRRQLVVVPGGVAGAPWRGLNEALRPGFEWRCVTGDTSRGPDRSVPEPERGDLADAVAWLGLTPARVARVQTAVAQLQAQRDWLGRVIEALDREPELPAAVLAEHLGMGLRTLQRRLESSRCTLHALRQQARLHRVLRLLSSTDTKIESIAHDCGFRSRGHFFRWFRECTGETPLEWRQGRMARSSAGHAHDE